MQNQSHTSSGFWNKVIQDSRRYPARSTSAVLKPLNVLYLLFLVPGFQLSLSIRIQEVLGKIPLIGKLLRRILWYMTTIFFGSDIDPVATIGAGVYFPHPYNIVIAGHSVIGSNVSINQSVTLGRRDDGETSDPIVGDNVAINTGAVIVGAITIGNHAKIGANAVVLQNVPERATAVGVPARCIMPS